MCRLKTLGCTKIVQTKCGSVETIENIGGLAHPLRHPAEAAPPFAVFEGWELGISGAKLLQKDRLIRVQGNEIIYLTLGPWTKPVQILVKPPAHLVFG